MHLVSSKSKCSSFWEKLSCYSNLPQISENNVPEIIVHTQMLERIMTIQYHERDPTEINININTQKLSNNQMHSNKYVAVYKRRVTSGKTLLLRFSLTLLLSWTLWVTSLVPIHLPLVAFGVHWNAGLLSSASPTLQVTPLILQIQRTWIPDKTWLLHFAPSRKTSPYKITHASFLTHLPGKMFLWFYH